jgi:hypothetical protein
MFDLKSDTQKQPASALHIYNWQIHFSFEHVDSERTNGCTFVQQDEWHVG